MIRAYAVSSVREAEAVAMSRLDEGELMSRAAAGLAEVASARLVDRSGTGGLHGQRVVALVGAGNNGGDALFASSLLARQGAAVVVVTVADTVHEAGLLAARDAGAVVLNAVGAQADPAAEISSALGQAELVIDGIVGIGGHPGLPTEIDGSPVVERVTHDDVPWLWPRPGPGDDKYTRGVLGIVAGGESYTGAALLAVTAAVCSGAGMVRYVGPSTPTLLVRSQVPEAVIGSGQVQAWLIGPGVDVTDDSDEGRAQRVAAQSALDSGLPCVVDAGGLDLIAQPRATPPRLTPHAGELARLLSRLDVPVDRATVAGAPVTHARRLADLTNCTILLKGSTTLVVAPATSDCAVRSQADAPAWLATAGSGDVLAGLAGTLLAAGLSPLDAGTVAALVHGLAADAATPGGPVRALGVAHAIPGVVAGLLARPTARP